MTPAQTILIIGAGSLLLAGASYARANVEAGEGDLPSWDVDTITDRAESFYNLLTEEESDTDMDTASKNIAAWLAMIRESEGTARAPNPYAVCYGYSYTITNFADHPKALGLWRGVTLPDRLCARSGFGPGCVSTAAGAYQFINPTWQSIKRALNLPDFSPESQDLAAIEATRRRGALEDVKAGRLSRALVKCAREWDSFPKDGDNAPGWQPPERLAMWFERNGGYIA